MPTKRVKAAAKQAVTVPAIAPVAAAAPAPLSLPYPQGAWRAVGYGLAFIQPGMGLLLALLYWPGQESRVRRFSRWCLALALLGWFIASGSEAVRSGVESGEWFIQPY